MAVRQRIQPRPCLHCQTVFRPRFNRSKFCTKLCCDISKRLPLRTCEHCARPIPADSSAGRRRAGRFCDRQCWKASLGTVEERFWRFVVKSDGCWLWSGSTTSKGYGQLACGTGGSPLHAHRLSWLIHFGAIPDGLEVCHGCDSHYPKGDITYRRCARPDHLWLGTHAENLADMAAKGRSKGN